MEIYQALEPDLSISRCWISSKKKKRERKPVISRYRFSKINLDRIKIDWQTVLHLPPRSRPMVWRGYGAGASRRCLRPVRSFETSFPGGPPENVTFHVRRRTYAPLLSRDSSRKSPPSLSSTSTLLPAWWKCGENQLCCEFYLLTVCFYSLYRFLQDGLERLRLWRLIIENWEKRKIILSINFFL